MTRVWSVRRRGFSLIEILVTTVVLAIGVVAASGLAITGISSARKAKNLQIATHCAQQQVERIVNAGFNAARVDAAYFPSPYTILQQNADGTGRIGFPVPELPRATGAIELAAYAGPTGTYPTNYLKSIQVTVAWHGSRHVSGTVTATGLIALHP
jgi:prepilin-type N-terminal cleavage/methylation domain-containing protein